MILDSNGLTKLRSHPHGSKLYLSIFQPKTLLAGRIDDATIEKGDRDINVGSFSSGSVSDVYSAATMLIGTAEGQDDIGRIRIRDIDDNGSSAIFTVAENAIDWANLLYITIIGYVEINAIFPKIINDPNNAEDVIFLKDMDIVYTDQNTVLGSMVCMGSDYAGFLDGGQEDVYYTATGTYNVKGDSLTYLWSFEGGTPTGSTALTPGNVAYTAPGHYTTKLVVSNSSGGEDVSYRYISIYDRPENGVNVPVLNWEFSKDISGSRSEGGYTLGLRVRQNISSVQPNALVVIFADEFYGTTDGSIGGNQPNRESIKFVGYIIEDSIEYNYAESYVEFDVVSVSELMKQAEGFSVSVETRTNPTTWFQLLDMDVQRAIYHYLRWHSTILLRTDFQYTGETLKFQYFDTDRSSLYDAIDSLMKNLLGQLVTDRQGKLWAEVLPAGRSNPLSPPTAMSILKQDWIGSPSIREHRHTPTSFIEMGGIAFSGAHTGTFSAILTNAPSETPLYRGSPEREEGFILSSQDRLNQMSGNQLATKNARFPEISFDLNGNYSNLDIAPIEKVYPFIAPEDTVRNVRIQNSPYIIERMDWNYNPSQGLLVTNVGITNLATGTAGVTLTVPDVPDDGGYSVPDIKVPPLPDLFFPPGQNPTSTGSSCCDYFGNLGIGLGVYSMVLTRTECIAPRLGPYGLNNEYFGWEYCSNPNMYNPTTGRADILNTGTISSYQFTLSGDWTVTNVDGTGGQNYCRVQLFNSGGTLLETAASVLVIRSGTPTPPDIIVGGNTIGNTGHFSVSSGFISNANFTLGNYLQASVLSNSSTTEYQVCFSNLKLEMLGTS